MLTLNADTPSANNFHALFRRGCALLALLALWPAALVAQNDKDTPILEPGKSIERELAGGAAHSYRVTLATNQFLHAVVEQKGVEVVVALFAPDGKKVAEVDGPNSTQGPEPLSAVAEAAGDYRLEVRSPDAKAKAGRYGVKIEELRAAQPPDGSRIAAQQAFMEAMQLLKEGSAGSRRQAIDKFQAALPLWRAAHDRAMEAETLNQIGQVHNSLSERQQALAYYNQSLPLMRAIGDRIGEAAALNNLGTVYNQLGERQQALDHYSQALPLIRAVGDRDGEAAILNNLGSLYNSLGEKRKALDHYNQALPLKRAAGDRRGEAVTLINAGKVYDESGEKQQALDYYARAVLLVRAIGARDIEAATLNNLGRVYYSLGEKQQALDHYNQSLSLARAVGNRRGEAATLDNIGLVYDLLGEKQKALDYHTRALPLMRAVGDRNNEVTALANIAKVERDRGNLTAARARIEEALTIVESLRTKIASQELRSSYFATVQKYYEFYIDLLMRLHRQQPSAGYDGRALQASERGRARSLLEVLTEANADIRQGVDSQLLERERALQQQLNAKAQQQTRLLNGRHTKEQAAALAKEIDALTTEFQQTAAQIRQTSPRYAALTQPVPLSAQEIQAQALDADTLLLEYALGDERSYLWAVTPTSLTSYELPKRAEIEDAARQFYTLLTARRQGATSGAPRKRGLGIALRQQADQKSMGVAASLSRMLLGPVAGQLGRKRLLIVGDGALQYVPFGALPAPSAQGLGIKDRGLRKDQRLRSALPQPLIVKHEIVNLPSASTLAVLRREARERQFAPKTLAVLADPVFESTDARIKKRDARTAGNGNRASAGTDENRGLGLVVEKTAKESGVANDTLRIPRLPGTRRETEQIVKLVPAAQRKQALDFAASRQAAIDPELGQYRYVHFATHGFLNSQHPELSGLMFTMFDEAGSAQDGFLRAHEVFNLKLNADVVTLSACQTGLGKEVRGEGLIGLTRGFMYAGAPRVVVSLWSVSDVATAELMARFYRGMLKGGMRPARALQAAQVSMLKDKKYASPFYWAAFTLQGEWR